MKHRKYDPYAQYFNNMTIEEREKVLNRLRTVIAELFTKPDEPAADEPELDMEVWSDVFIE